MTVGRSKLYAGVSRNSVTPPVGVRLAGSLRDTLSEGIHDKLVVTALYLNEGDVAVVIVGCDLILMPPEDALVLRQAVGDAVGIGPQNVLVSLSHSHATPSPVSWREYDYEASPAEREAVTEFFGRLSACVIEAAVESKRNALPARVASAVGSSDINVNRRERRADGVMVLGSNPGAPVDRDVNVLRIDLETGNPLALVFNYACHPDVLGPKSALISPDWVGAARQAAEAITGATPLFLQGASGDIYPSTGIVNGQDGVRVADRLGRRLGAEAARVFETLDTVRRPGHRAEWVSTNAITTNWFYEDVPSPSAGQLAVADKLLKMPLRELPSEHEAVALVRQRVTELGAVPASAPLSARLIANRRATWARLQLQAIRDQHPLSLSFELQAIRIGEAAIIGFPAELFTEIGMRIKAASPYPQTFVVGLANGSYFYVPTKMAFDLGGYEVNSYQNYMRPTGPTPEWEGILVEESCALLSNLQAASVPS